jgi:hypothetical protein
MQGKGGQVYVEVYLLRGRRFNLSCYFGMDFLQKTGLLIDLYQGSDFFRFDPDNKLPLIGRASALDSPSICTSTQTGPDLSHLTPPLVNSVLEVIDEFPDVLTPRLGPTTLLEYDIELLDNVPVKIPPYRLCPLR